MLILLSLLLIIISATTTFKITPFFIKRLKERGIVGKNMNSLKKSEFAEMGGITVLFGFIASMLASIFIFSYLKFPKSLDLDFLFAGFLTIIIIGLIGIVDDLIGWKKGIKQWQHALLPIFAALPLMALAVGKTQMAFPFFGSIEFGFLYSLIIVPIGVTGAANAANMLAGMNGLEAGLGIINVSTILIISLILERPETTIIMATMLGGLLAFLYFNWYPAKIIPGDALTLMVGAGIASAVIIGNMEKIGLLLFSIYFIELILKAKHKFKSECFGIPQKDNTLKPRPEGGSITHWVMRRGNFTEKQVVLIILGIQTLIAIIVFINFWIQFTVVQ